MPEENLQPDEQAVETPGVNPEDQGTAEEQVPPEEEPGVSETEEQAEGETPSGQEAARDSGEDVDQDAAEKPESQEEPSGDVREEQVLAELGKMEADDEEGGEDTMSGIRMPDDSFDSNLGGLGPDVPEARPADFQQLGSEVKRSTSQNLDLLMDVSLPISIELGRTSMNIQEILNLGPGSVVELDKLAGEPVDLLVNSKIVARGEVVVIDENFGIRVTSLISPEERLKSLGE